MIFRWPTNNESKIDVTFKKTRCFWKIKFNDSFHWCFLLVIGLCHNTEALTVVYCETLFENSAIQSVSLIDVQASFMYLTFVEVILDKSTIILQDPLGLEGLYSTKEKLNMKYYLNVVSKWQILTSESWTMLLKFTFQFSKTRIWLAEEYVTAVLCRVTSGDNF